MDAPAALFGSQHRILFHTPQEIQSLAFMRFLSHSSLPQFCEDVLAGNLHLVSDTLNTELYKGFEVENKSRKRSEMLQEFFLSQILKKK